MAIDYRGQPITNQTAFTTTGIMNKKAAMPAPLKMPTPKVEEKKPEEKKMPFFSLVGIRTKDNWLFARGRGGGLAIWGKS